MRAPSGLHGRFRARGAIFPFALLALVALGEAYSYARGASFETRASSARWRGRDRGTRPSRGQGDTIRGLRGGGGKEEATEAEGAAGGDESGAVAAGGGGAEWSLKVPDDHPLPPKGGEQLVDYRDAKRCRAGGLSPGITCTCYAVCLQSDGASPSVQRNSCGHLSPGQPHACINAHGIHPSPYHDFMPLPLAILLALCSALSKKMPLTTSTALASVRLLQVSRCWSTQPWQRIPP